ncbi:hypothetical protein SAVIM40S_07107 [Streptomyces avidinii]
MRLKPTPSTETAAPPPQAVTTPTATGVPTTGAPTTGARVAADRAGPGRPGRQPQDRSPHTTVAASWRIQTGRPRTAPSPPDPTRPAAPAPPKTSSPCCTTEAASVTRATSSARPRSPRHHNRTQRDGRQRPHRPGVPHPVAEHPHELRDRGMGHGVGVQIPRYPFVVREQRLPPRHHQCRQDRREQRTADARPPQGIFAHAEILAPRTAGRRCDSAGRARTTRGRSAPVRRPRPGGSPGPAWPARSAAAAARGTTGASPTAACAPAEGRARARSRRLRTPPGPR